MNALFRTGLLFSILILLTQCRTSKRWTATHAPTDQSTEFLSKQLLKQVKDFDWISMKVRLHYDDPYQTLRGTARIRSKKDSIIWLNVTKLGIEALRARITPESIEVLNRIDKTYQLEHFKSLYTKYGIRLDFKILQNLLIGNPIIFADHKFESRMDSTGYDLSTTHDNIHLNHHLRALDYLIDRLTLKHPKKGQLQVSQKEYMLLSDAFYYPTERIYQTIEENGAQTTLELKIVQSKINQPANTPFSIPDHYEKI